MLKQHMYPEPLQQINIKVRLKQFPTFTRSTSLTRPILTLEK